MNATTALDHIRIVLVHTTHPGNIGAAARAMKTMGIHRMSLVAPKSFPDPVASARASGADDILATASVVDTLPQALRGTVFSAALSARRREHALPVQSAREIVPTLLSYCAHGDVALVFGTESSGLTNEEAALCSALITIPTDPAFSSLNLAAAVQLLCYELRSHAFETPLTGVSAGEPATFEQIEGFYRHLDQAMQDAGFYQPENPRQLWPKLRRLFGRAHLEQEEVNILRGILNAVVNRHKVPRRPGS